MGWEVEEEEEDEEETAEGGGASQRTLPCCVKNFAMRLSTANIGRAFL